MLLPVFATDNSSLPPFFCCCFFTFFFLSGHKDRCCRAGETPQQPFSSPLIPVWSRQSPATASSRSAAVAFGAATPNMLVGSAVGVTPAGKNSFPSLPDQSSSPSSLVSLSVSSTSSFSSCFFLFLHAAIIFFRAALLLFLLLLPSLQERFKQEACRYYVRT